MNKSKNIITILAVVVIILVVFLINFMNLQMNSKEILKYKQNMISTISYGPVIRIVRLTSPSP